MQFHWLHSVETVDNRESMKPKTDILKNEFRWKVVKSLHNFRKYFPCKVIMWLLWLLLFSNRIPIATRPVLCVESSKKFCRTSKSNSRRCQKAPKFRTWSGLLYLEIEKKKEREREREKENCFHCEVWMFSANGNRASDCGSSYIFS